MGRGKRVESVLSSLPEPSASQQVVVVTGIPGGNLLQVQSADGRSFLCRVPAKFRNRVWVLKGGYLIVEMACTEDDGEALGVHSKPSRRARVRFKARPVFDPVPLFSLARASLSQASSASGCWRDFHNAPIQTAHRPYFGVKIDYF